MKLVNVVAFILLVISGINVGLVALANLNIVSAVLGAVPGVENLFNILVGVSAVYIGVTRKKELGL